MQAFSFLSLLFSIHLISLDSHSEIHFCSNPQSADEIALRKTHLEICHPTTTGKLLGEYR